MGRLLRLVLLTVAILSVSGIAQAAFLGSDSDPLGVGTATLTAPAAPTLTSTSTSVVVTWKAVTLSNGRAPTGYEVRRHVGSDTGTIVCSTTTALTCSETKPSATVSYTVTATYKLWSKRSAATTYTVVKSAATSTFTVNDSPGTNGWYQRSAVSVHLSATADSGSSVRSITYRVNDGPQIVTSASSIGFSIGEQGENTVTYFATDSSGRAEVARTVVVKLDNGAPEVTLTSRTGDMTHAQWKASCPTRFSTGGICGTASDGVSGFASADYVLTRSSDGKYYNGSSWVTGATRVSTTTDGDSWYDAVPDAKLATARTWYTVTIYATDEAGNESNTTKNFSVGP